MICSMTQRFFCPLIEDSATVQLQLNQAWLSSRPRIYMPMSVSIRPHTQRNLDKISTKEHAPAPSFRRMFRLLCQVRLDQSHSFVTQCEPELVRIDLIHPSHMHNEFSNLYCVQALPSKACPSTWDSFTLLCLRVRCTFPFAKLRGGDALHFSSSVS